MLLYKNRIGQFKPIISIDKAVISSYRTIILQAPQIKRLTEVKFFGKN